MCLLRKLVLLLPLLFLLSCTEEQLSPLRLGTNIWPGYEPLYLARQNGYLNDNKVHLVEFSSSSQTIQAFRNRLIDAAALTLDEVLLLLESSENLNIVLVMDISDGGDAIIGQADISMFSDIRGKRVGVENNALGAYMITRALEEAELDKHSIEVVQLDINEHENAFLQRQVDAVVTFEPVRSKLLKAGGHVLFDSHQLPNEIVDVLVVRSEFLNQRHMSVQYLLDGWYQALNYINEHPRRAAKILGLRMQLDVDETLVTYDGLKLPTQEDNRKLVQGRNPGLLLPATNMAKLMLEQGLLKRAVDPSTLFTDTQLQHK